MKFDPETGNILQTVQIPAKQTTSCCWGGPDLDILYVTTGRYSRLENVSTSKYKHINIPAALWDVCFVRHLMLRHEMLMLKTGIFRREEGTCMSTLRRCNTSNKIMFCRFNNLHLYFKSEFIYNDCKVLPAFQVDGIRGG